MPPIAPWMRPLPWGAAPPQHRQARQGGASGIQHISSSLPATSLEQQEATANTLEHRSEKLVQYNYVVHQKTYTRSMPSCHLHFPFQQVPTSINFGIPQVSESSAPPSAPPVGYSVAPPAESLAAASQRHQPTTRRPWTPRRPTSERWRKLLTRKGCGG